MTRQYPLQTGANCVVYAYWVAMQEALYKADPFRKLTITVQDIENIIGAPAPVNGKTVEILKARTSSLEFPSSIWNAFKFLDGVTGSINVRSTWRAGFAHALTFFDGKQYDPGTGEVSPADYSMVGPPVDVFCWNPQVFPYEHWYYRIGLVRSIVRRFLK